MKPLAIAAAADDYNPLPPTRPTGFSKIEGRPSIQEKRPPLKVTGLFWGLKHSTIQNLHFAKNWSKTTNQALNSGPKKTLPRIWGHHHQQMIKTKNQ